MGIFPYYLVLGFWHRVNHRLRRMGETLRPGLIYPLVSPQGPYRPRRLSPLLYAIYQLQLLGQLLYLLPSGSKWPQCH